MMQQQQPVYQQPVFQQQPPQMQQQPVYQQPQMQQQQPQMTPEEYNAYVAQQQQAQKNINQIQNASMKNPNNAGFVPLSQTTVTAQPPMGFNASAPNIPPQVQQNKDNLKNSDAPEMVNNFKKGLERMVNNMFGNNENNANAQMAAAQMAAMQQAQAQQQQAGFFNTTWGKAALVGGGVGVGIIGHKMFSSGGGVNQQDISMLADAGKTLSDASMGDIAKAFFG